MSEKNYEFIDVIAAKYLQSVNGDMAGNGVPSGFTELDQMTGGFGKGELTVVAARPAVGKTALALTSARFLSVKNKRPVLFFSLEMSKEQIAARILASEAKVACCKVRTGQLTERERTCLEMNCDAIKGARLIIDDTAGMSVSEICERSAQLKKEYGIEMVIIDYFQLISLDERLASRQQELSEIAIKLKAMAKELDIPVVVLSQLSRAVELRDDHRPLLSDLRTSGSLEQYADMVLFIYRDKYYNKDTRYGDIAELIIARQKSGCCGTVYLDWHPEFAEFTDFTGELPAAVITMDEIMEATCREFHVDRNSVCSKLRNGDVVLARQVIMYLCREYTDMALEEIAKALGKRDHVTVMCGADKIEKMLPEDPQLSERIEHITKSL